MSGCGSRGVVVVGGKSVKWEGCCGCCCGGVVVVDGGNKMCEVEGVGWGGWFVVAVGNDVESGGIEC